MESPKLTKQEYVRLGTFSVALALGTACSVLGSSVVGVPVAVAGTLLAGVAGGVVANEAGAISKQLGKDKAPLRNNDLTSTVGKAIAAVIVAVADSKHFPKETETSLRKMAKLAEAEWENMVKNLPGEFAPIEESQLTEFFAYRPENFSNLTALDVDLWAALLDYLRWEAGVILGKPVITHTADRLHQIFPKALREALREDFQSDGKAFARMVLDLFAVMRAQISENHALISQRFNEIKQQNPSTIPADFNLYEFEKRLELLSRKNQEEIAAEVRSVARQIDSGFLEVLQQMGVVQTGITELLVGSNNILDRLEDLSQKSQQQYEKLLDIIADSTDIQTLQTNFWQFLQEKAKSPPNWLLFFTEENLKIAKEQTPPPSVQKLTPTIPANKSLWMLINWKITNYQLLLFNRSEQELCLLCPSSGYAPNSIIEEWPILLPLKNSWADENNSNFEFGTGKEEFLAIALEKPLSLLWLTPRPEEERPELNAKRIKELSEQLRQQDNLQVFYQSFDVVETVRS
ncbi:hypothetical protein H6F77_17510 [Microcoleus sp. FACHB-831]|uniref:hypothetical protein n=1 Tax=Microcoleus sp. FACHB-831 TaxID=2692827 RepID=UPI0016856400|nr:hypothetical protein [Microcoleus sp. FACHB-831]MBD1922852.1 hypothetical protein [Microcoleus sp. FACHB-831]